MTTATSNVVSLLGAGKDLTREQTGLVIREMLSGGTTQDENLEFLRLLTQKGETDAELTGMLDVMQEFAVPMRPAGDAIDMCGTGGDGLDTFNISTAASFVVAAAGGTVAKHGNRSSSGGIGSADIFERLGCDLGADAETTAGILDRHGICFMFAQTYHPAMRHVAPARKRLGTRTAFNLLGPLSNPARVAGQLVGVSETGMLERIPRLLHGRGLDTIMVVHSDCGADEFSTCAPNHMTLLDSGGLRRQTISAEDMNMHPSSLDEIRVSGTTSSLRAFAGVLEGTANRAMIETCALNAAGGLVVAGIRDDMSDAAVLALDTIYGGRAWKKLESFVDDAGDASMLEAMRHG